MLIPEVSETVILMVKEPIHGHLEITYKGEWNMGKCEGNGVFTGKIYGKDTVMAGIWKNGDIHGSQTFPSESIYKL